MTRHFIALLAFVLAMTTMSFAQTTSGAAITYGHHHLNVTNIEEHKKFWVGALGGTMVKAGPMEVVKFPGVLVFVRQQAPTGGTKGTIVNHIGFQVVDLRQAINKLRAAGFPMVTREEVTSVPPESVKDDIAYIPNQDSYVAMTMGPDSTKVELVENKMLSTPIALHHIHFFTPNMDEMRDWYVKNFGATPGTRGAFKTAELPGVSLTMAPTATPVVGTKGRTLDHIGFEVKNLEALTKKLEAAGITMERPYSKNEQLGISLAFFTDPWGTYIELTEGLSRF